MNSVKSTFQDKFVQATFRLLLLLVAMLVVTVGFDVEWSEISDLWPLIIVVFGIFILPMERSIKTMLVIAIITFVCIAYQVKTNSFDDEDDIEQEYARGYSRDYYDDYDDEEDEDMVTMPSIFDEF